MIVVAIIGILAAIAIPAYQNFVARSKVSEAIVFAGFVKPSIADYYYQNQTYPTSLSQVSESSLSGKYVESMSIGESGAIMVTVDYGIGHGTIVLTPSADQN
jgi:type IV pilus assembly protein PilA